MRAQLTRKDDVILARSCKSVNLRLEEGCSGLALVVAMLEILWPFEYIDVTELSKGFHNPIPGCE